MRDSGLSADYVKSLAGLALRNIKPLLSMATSALVFVR
jgi:hypothetical protein